MSVVVTSVFSCNCNSLHVITYEQISEKAEKAALLSALLLFHLQALCQNDVFFLSPLLQNAVCLLNGPTLPVKKARGKQNTSTFTQTIRSLSAVLATLSVTAHSFPFVSYCTRRWYTRSMARKTGINT